MDCKNFQLGSKTTAMVSEKEPDRIKALENQVEDLGVMLGTLFKKLNSNKAPTIDDAVAKGETTLNKDGIPVNTNLFGLSNGKPYIAYVTATGYILGNTHYNSLSAMAQHITGKRRNGWDFWRDLHGRTIGEVYKR